MAGYNQVENRLLLNSIHSVDDLRKLDERELSDLAAEIRSYMIDVVSKNGGHLGPSLGVVELTIALHYIFKTPDDRIIWDVGHQTYAHKILTGRKNDFLSIRRHGGLSGFPKVCESEFDCYDTGHSSTSLSLALGEATARDISRKHHKVIAVIGDGALGGGLAFEALNNIGHLKKDMIIILNDNEHSISRNVGALSHYLTNLISGTTYNRLTKKLYRSSRKIPYIGKYIPEFMDRIRMGVKNIFVPAHFFEELGIRYFGPVDGHDIENLTYILRRIRKINSGPKVIHIITKKGKGFKPAEKDPIRFHGTGPFDPRTGVELKKKALSYSAVAGETLVNLASKNSNIVAITAAMSSGTGLDEFSRKYPSRFFDVGIAEAHAVTFSAALARNGLKPFFAVYSSFLQRGYDQLIHDIAIMCLPAVFLIDRAGIVGEDGETHHGLFDISFIRSIPNFTLLIPADGDDLRDMIFFASKLHSPVAIRYPRGACGNVSVNCSKPRKRSFFEPEILSEGKDLLIVALADMRDHALKTAELLSAGGTSVGVAIVRSVKPFDAESINELLKKYRRFITIENSIVSGGFGEMVEAALCPEHRSKSAGCFGFPDRFIPHGTNEQLFKMFSIDPSSLAEKLLLKSSKKRPIKK